MPLKFYDKDKSNRKPFTNSPFVIIQESKKKRLFISNRGNGKLESASDIYLIG